MSLSYLNPSFMPFFMALSGMVVWFLTVPTYGGIFMFIDSSSYLSLVYMSGFVVGLVLWVEYRNFTFYLINTLLLLCVMFFFSGDIFLMFMTYEGVLFPVLLSLILDGNQVEKIKASYYLIIYLILCAVPFLYSIMMLESWNTGAYLDLVVSSEMKWSLTVIFLVKVPVFGLHSWLPSVHVESPTYGSVILAGVLLKLSLAGLMRISFVLRTSLNNTLMFLSFMGFTVSAFLCITQSDVKSLVAYSSVAHMNLMLFGFLVFFSGGKEGAVLLSLAHGFTSSVMFFFSGVMMHSANTRSLYYLGGLLSSNLMLMLTIFCVMITNFGVPPSISFASELMIISNGLSFSLLLSLLFALYVVLVCYYTLNLFLSFLLGKELVYFNTNNTMAGLCLLIMSFNLFALLVYFY